MLSAVLFLMLKIKKIKIIGHYYYDHTQL